MLRRGFWPTSKRAARGFRELALEGRPLLLAPLLLAVPRTMRMTEYTFYSRVRTVGRASLLADPVCISAGFHVSPKRDALNPTLFSYCHNQLALGGLGSRLAAVSRTGEVWSS